MGDGLNGLDGVKRQIAELFAKAPGAVGAALYQEGLAVDAVAVQKTPVDTGRLRATHYVGPPQTNGDHIEVPVGFGTDYAVYVHERTDVAHTTGEAKFLEKAMHERSSGFEVRLARRARKNLRDGVTAAPIDGSVPTSPQDVGPMFGPGRKELGRQKRAARRADKRARKHHAKALKSLARKQKTTAKRERRKAATAAKREASKARKAAKRAEKRQQRAQKKLDRTRNRASPKRFDF
jgi:hypothetical protein